MNITTREGRKELRRGKRLSPRKRAEADIAALDGLDIAEEAMRAECVIRTLIRLDWWPGWEHWYCEAVTAQREALAEWDTWKEKR